MGKFKIVSDYKMMGDQPQAVKTLVDGIKRGKRSQTLMGVTGSGKTFTMANVIEQVQKPTLVISHNKTLAAQLCGEFKEFFPDNAVEYFVSYYDYYQPEAYVPASDTYIEKDSDINQEIEKLRHSATAALSERKDVIVVASVSCIYGIGSPVDYETQVLSLRTGAIKARKDILRKLVDIQYKRNDTGMDVLTHAMESYVSVSANEISEALSEKAIQIVGQYLVRSYKNSEDSHARQKMHTASTIAGVAFDAAGLGVNHALAHQLGAWLHIPHGRANAILLPHVIEFNTGIDITSCSRPSYPYHVERYENIAKIRSEEHTLTPVTSVSRMPSSA